MFDARIEAARRRNGQFGNQPPNPRPTTPQWARIDPMGEWADQHADDIEQIAVDLLAETWDVAGVRPIPTDLWEDAKRQAQQDLLARPGPLTDANSQWCGPEVDVDGTYYWWDTDSAEWISTCPPVSINGRLIRVMPAHETELNLFEVYADDQKIGLIVPAAARGYEGWEADLWCAVREPCGGQEPGERLFEEFDGAARDWMAGRDCATCGGPGVVHWDWDDPGTESTRLATAFCPDCGIGSGRDHAVVKAPAQFPSGPSPVSTPRLPARHEPVVGKTLTR